MAELHIDYRSVDALQPHDRNPRIHSKKQIRQIADSIKAFGFTNPILIDGAGRIVAGHGRLAAAKLLGIAWRPKSRKSLEQLISEAEQAFLITPEALRSSSKQRKLTQARAWIAHQAVTLRVASLSHVARLLQRSESSLREAVQRYYPS